MKKFIIAAAFLVALPSSGLAQNIGDVVYLRSGGPPMTVTGILPRPDLSGTDIGVHWFGGTTMMAGTFPAAAVVVSDPSPVIAKSALAEKCKMFPAEAECL